MDRAAINAQAFVRAALAARRDGYRPDIIVAHSGWGAGMFAKDVFPEAAFVAYCEWWYRHPAADVAYLAALDGPRAAASARGADARAGPQRADRHGPRRRRRGDLPDRLPGRRSSRMSSAGTSR